MTVTTEDVLGVVTRSAHNWGEGRRAWLADELAKLGAPGEELVAAALPALESEDRNVRVRALWALSAIPDPRATEGIVRALRDPVRRVREVAIKAARPHHLTADVVAVLRSIVDDEGETDRLRRHAFFVLSSTLAQEAVPAVAEEALTGLMTSERFRLSVLHRLCRSPNQTDASRAVLREFVRTGTKDEAVMATRALCGHLLVRVDAWLTTEQRQRVRDTYDVADEYSYPNVKACWIPRDEALALAEEVGYPVVP